jgi:hypothetical protein
MALVVGTLSGDSFSESESMAKRIYDNIKQLRDGTGFGGMKFRMPSTGGVLSDVDKEYNARISAIAMSDAVIQHIKANMSIKGIKTTIDNPTVNSAGSINPLVLVTTTVGVPVTHVPPNGAPIDVTGNVPSATTQNNDGTGHVE